MSSSILANLLLLAILVVIASVVLFFAIGSWVTRRRMAKMSLEDRSPLEMMMGGIGIVSLVSAQLITKRHTVRAVLDEDLAAFQPRKLSIGGEASHWLVHDIRIGNRSQLATPAPMPGFLFSEKAIGNTIFFDTVQTRMTMEIDVSYEGPAENGAVFRALMTGRAIEAAAQAR